MRVASSCLCFSAANPDLRPSSVSMTSLPAEDDDGLHLDALATSGDLILEWLKTLSLKRKSRELIC